MDKRWHVLLKQDLSEYMSKQFDMVIVSNTAVDAINGVLERAYEKEAFTPLLSYKVLHVIPW
jgi:hypothetical protein